MHPAAAQIIAELAQYHGRSAAFEETSDKAFPVVLKVDDIRIAFSRSDTNNSLFLMAPIGCIMERTATLLWSVYEKSADYARRRTRVAIHPETKNFILVGEIFLTNATLQDLAIAINDFIDDIADARQMMDRGSATSAKTAELTEVDFTAPQVLLRV